MESLGTLSDEQLVDGILTWAGRIAAGEAQQLAFIAEFDRREAWGGHGLLSCAHWLAWRTSLSPAAAREKVRVARALSELPLLQEAFAAGRLSYSQVRAVTRVATPEDQQRWLDAARASTASQLERLVRGVRRARKVDEDAADPERAAWQMEARKTYDDDGNVVYRLVLPAEQAAVLDAALEVVRAALEREAAAGLGGDASAEAARPQTAVRRRRQTLPRKRVLHRRCPPQPPPRKRALPHRSHWRRSSSSWRAPCWRRRSRPPPAAPACS